MLEHREAFRLAYEALLHANHLLYTLPLASAVDVADAGNKAAVHRFVDDALRVLAVRARAWGEELEAPSVPSAGTERRYEKEYVCPACQRDFDKWQVIFKTSAGSHTGTIGATALCPACYRNLSKRWIESVIDGSAARENAEYLKGWQECEEAIRAMASGDDGGAATRGATSPSSPDAGTDPRKRYSTRCKGGQHVLCAGGAGVGYSCACSCHSTDDVSDAGQGDPSVRREPNEILTGDTAGSQPSSGYPSAEACGSPMGLSGHLHVYCRLPKGHEGDHGQFNLLRGKVTIELDDDEPHGTLVHPSGDGCNVRWGGGYKVCPDGHRCVGCENDGRRHVCKCGASLHGVWSEAVPTAGTEHHVELLAEALMKVLVRLGVLDEWVENTNAYEMGPQLLLGAQTFLDAPDSAEREDLLAAARDVLRASTTKGGSETYQHPGYIALHSLRLAVEAHDSNGGER